MSRRRASLSFAFERGLIVCWIPILAIVISMLASESPVQAEAPELTSEQKSRLARHFGFGPLEAYKLENGITQLRTADFNNDGATDIAVANNAKSTIDLLLQETESREPDPPKGVNDLVNPPRFDHQKVSVTWQIATLRAADVTGDGNVDLVFTGNPRELVVLPGEGNGKFGKPLVRRVSDLLVISSSMDVADMNGDGRLDVLALSESDVVIFFQPKFGGLGQATRFAHSIKNPLMLAVADLDGNKHADVVLLSDDNTYPLHVRYQDDHGKLGAVDRLKLPTLRSLAFEKCLDRPQEDLFAIERVSGRLKRWILSDQGDDAEADWTVRHFPIPGDSQVDQLPLAIGRLTDDRYADVVTANVDAAQMVLYPQTSSGGLQLPKSFGGQIKMRDMSCYDVDDDGQDEVFVLSAEEEMIGRSAYTGQRLTFPEPMPISGRPYAMCIGQPSDDAVAHLAYITKDEERDYLLIIQPVEVDSEDDERIARIELKEMDDPPSAMRWADVNQDGREDLLIFASFGPLQVALQQKDGTFAGPDASGASQTGLVKNAKPEVFAYADTNGDGARDIVLAQKTFVRAMRVSPEGAWEVQDQYNAPTSDAELSGICVVPISGETRPALAMHDRKTQEVHYYTPGESGSYEKSKSVPVGAMNVKAMTSARLGGTETSSILLADEDRLVVILPDVPAAEMSEEAAFESSIENARLRQAAVGDLNHDGRTDLAVTDSSEHFVEILTFGPDESLVLATKFRIFAKKQYQVGDHEGIQPHWVAIEDVTNDGHDDLLFIAHDRILLYPGQ